MAYGYIYKTELSNGQYYIGKHKYNGLHDKKYIGSGTRLREVIKNDKSIKIKNTPMFYTVDEKSLSLMEEIAIGNRFKDDNKCLNLMAGGKYILTEKGNAKRILKIKEYYKNGGRPANKKGRYNTCIYCGNKFWVSPSSLSKNFCSSKCRFVHTGSYRTDESRARMSVSIKAAFLKKSKDVEWRKNFIEKTSKSQKKRFEDPKEREKLKYERTPEMRKNISIGTKKAMLKVDMSKIMNNWKENNPEAYKKRNERISKTLSLKNKI